MSETEKHQLAVKTLQHIAQGYRPTQSGAWRRLTTLEMIDEAREACIRLGVQWEGMRK